MRLYKLTDASGRTRIGESNETQWGDGVTHQARGAGARLCSKDVIHAYADPVLAEIMDPAHGSYGPDGVLWECEGDPVADDGTKVGCKTLTTIRRLSRDIKLTTAQRTRFAILVAKQVSIDPKFIEWADRWLSGIDRTAASAASASTWASAVSASTWAAAASAASATSAASEAAWAASEAASESVEIDFISIAREAIASEKE